MGKPKWSGNGRGAERMKTGLDHLVVAADTLARGIDHVEALLGVRATTGGKHAAQSTHNALIRLGMDRYLEIIAVDPDAVPPSFPRWFGLDDPAIRESLAHAPRLLTWVARTDSLERCLSQCGRDLGEIRSMQRGELRWRMTFTPDGALVEQGLVPPLIEWHVPVHPAGQLPDVGCELLRLEGVHPDPDRVCGTLDEMGLGGALSVSRSQREDVGLLARIRTPTGEKALGMNP